MNVFVAGIHGVGKSYLASRAAATADMVHTSASQLIRDERALTTWAEDKRVVDVDANQSALTSAVRRHNEAGTRLLLDGHFVLLGVAGEMTRLEAKVFAALDLDGVVLVEADPQTVADRIETRDKLQLSIEHLHLFMEAERCHATTVCTELQIPLTVLFSPSLEEFEAAMAGFRDAV
jgi:adenylate kinase